MPIVHKLPPSVADRIAAGEVVEKPASALKELLENALDAGATTVMVRLEAGGKRLLEVVDDGCGMPREDALLALERFATSKIADLGDLDHISTYGFRGEALPSIAAVSHFALLTRPPEGNGTHITCEGGHIASVEDWAGAPGTTVRAADLFYNLPARRKFLGSDWRELSLCLTVFNGIALAAPGVSFRIAHNERWLSTLTPSDALTRTVELLGGDLAGNLLETHRAAGEVTITGLLSIPAVTRPHAGNIFFLVNGRHVTSRALMRALLRGYGNHLLPRRYPAVVISIALPPHQVDANVHPRKEEVRLLGEQQICRALESMVREELDSHFPRLESSFETAEAAGIVGAALGEPPSTIISAPNPALDMDFTLPLQQAQSSPNQPAGIHPTPSAESPSFVDGLRILGQFDSTYILVEKGGVLAIIDQHAAHERILYEQLKAQQSEQLPAQVLLVPITLELPLHLREYVASNLGMLSTLGFEVEPFGEDTVLLRSVSAVVCAGREEEALTELLDGLVEETRAGSPDRDRQLYRLACVGAIKAGDILTMAEMQALLGSLARTSHPNICPHGRPIIIELHSEELERRFRRRV
jgi:DNA mismatch repair protein MutL